MKQKMIAVVKSLRLFAHSVFLQPCFYVITYNVQLPGTALPLMLFLAMFVTWPTLGTAGSNGTYIAALVALLAGMCYGAKLAQEVLLFFGHSGQEGSSVLAIGES